jgi:small subunit ribosomal protein S20
VAKRTASAKKQARAGARRTVRNRAVRSEVKTLIVKARRSFSESPVAEAERFASAVEAVRALDRAASKGILHPNNAARRKGRLARQMAKVASAATPAPSKAAAGKGGRKSSAAPAPAPAAKKKS